LDSKKGRAEKGPGCRPFPDYLRRGGRYGMNRLTWRGGGFFLPAAIVFLVFYYRPVLQNLYISFFSWNMVSPSMRYVGFSNYMVILQSAEFVRILGNTCLFVLFLLIFNFFLPYGYSFILAFVLKKGQFFYRAALFLPSILSLAAASIIFLWIYNPLAGPLQVILQFFGGHSPRWFKEPALVIFAVSTIIGWKVFGYNLIIFLSAMISVPREMIEAARLENASDWVIFRRIICPQISPAAMYVFTVTVVFGLQYVLVPVNMLTQGGPDQGSSNLVYVIYQYAFVFYKTGVSAAYAVITMAVYLGLLYMRNRFLEKKVYYEN
jgi:sn-glycerol 3-phosphate transport system permease protein